MSPAALARRSPWLRWLALFAAICAAAATGAERQRGDPAAQAASDESALEYWDLVARFESNHRLFARYMITNEGPGDQYGVAVGHLVHPDGSISDFRNGRRKGRWHLSPDGLHMKVGSSYLDQREATRRFGTDNDRRGIKIHLAFVSDGPVTWREPDGEEPYRVDLLDMSAPVEGTIWVNGMDEPQTLRGRVGITHTVVDESESDLVLRRIDFFSLSHGVALYLSDRTRPDGVRSRWLAVERDGVLLRRLDHFELELGPGGRDEDYPLPSVLRLRGEGVEGEIQLGLELVRHDPFESLPSVFRLLLSFRMRPRWVWANSPYEVKIEVGPDSSVLELRGSGITSVTYLNPVTPSTKAKRFAPSAGV